jgi:hypothetical protein
MISASPSQRQAVQGIAAGLTRDSADPAVVNALAGPLLAWAQAAVSRDDLERRIHALQQQRSNCPFSRRVLAGPEAFLGNAQALYDYATATAGQAVAR